MVRPELWPNSGFKLLERDGAGRLVVTDGFLRAYLGRPEMVPVAESCDAERALHAGLMADPKRPVGDEEVAALADADARGNYGIFLGFRDRLVSDGTLEACYQKLFQAGDVGLPVLFVNQMAHAIVRNILEDVTDPFQARAAELLFREQNATVEEGAILLGDAETISMLAATGGMGNLGKLVVDGGTKPKQVDLDVLQPENADIYWDRNERFDTVLDLTFPRPGLDALARVLEAWIAHFLGASVKIQPVQQITDERWVWHVGLDKEASVLLNDLYQDNEVSDERMQRLLSLFRLEFDDPNQMQSDIKGKPVYLALCMTPEKTLRLKPQNLLVNLPLARSA
ncbi:MAG: hypothetical protein HQ512_07925 [Rhodospirillales bacterium]|nr:hypothetical protein [Rhodospirillales bacterium]